MSYKLLFLPSALKEWKKLDPNIQKQLKKKLSERLSNPHVKASQLYGFNNHYKIKLRASGYRLVYEVIDEKICVMVIAVGKREKNFIYKKKLKNGNADKHIIPVPSGQKTKISVNINGLRDIFYYFTVRFIPRFENG